MKILYSNLGFNSKLMKFEDLLFANMPYSRFFSINNIAKQKQIIAPKVLLPSPNDWQNDFLSPNSLEVSTPDNLEYNIEISCAITTNNIKIHENVINKEFFGNIPVAAFFYADYASRVGMAVPKVDMNILSDISAVKPKITRISNNGISQILARIDVHFVPGSKRESKFEVSGKNWKTGRDYSIKYNTPTDDQDPYGCYWSKKGCIFIWIDQIYADFSDKNTRDKVIVKVLLHELIHALLDVDSYFEYNTEIGQFEETLDNALVIKCYNGDNTIRNFVKQSQIKYYAEGDALYENRKDNLPLEATGHLMNKVHLSNDKGIRVLK